jgi:hypothetical protein
VQPPPIRSSWNETRILVRGPLTDKAIEKYRKQGWYSAEFKEARREMIARRNAKRQERESRREGNFLVFTDGRKVYSPQ